MAIFALTTSPTQIDDGTSKAIDVTNTGTVNITLSTSMVLKPGQCRAVLPAGTAVTATASPRPGQTRYLAEAQVISDPLVDLVSSGAGGTAGGAPDWAAATAYKANQLVMNGGILYRANADFTSAGSFNGANWTAVVNAAPLSNTNPQAISTVASAGTSAEAARIDHVHVGSSNLIFGDGSIGDVVLDGTTTPAATLPWYGSAAFTKSGSTYYPNGPIYCRNLTVNAGVTLVPAGHPVFCTGTLTNRGTISATGADATAATGGAGAGRLATYTSLGVGGTGVTGTTGAGAGYSTPSPSVAGGWGGGVNGAGGSGTSGAGGASNTGLSGSNYPGVFNPRHIATATTGIMILGQGTNLTAANIMLTGGAGGASGAGDGTNAGGGGGGGGGVVILNVASFDNASGTVTAKGGHGGTPAAGNCGGGGGGAGGVVLVNCKTNIATGTVTAAGGTGGSGTGTGAAGGTPTTAGYTHVVAWS